MNVTVFLVSMEDLVRIKSEVTTVHVLVTFLVFTARVVTKFEISCNL